MLLPSELTSYRSRDAHAPLWTVSRLFTAQPVSKGVVVYACHSSTSQAPGNSELEASMGYKMRLLSQTKQKKTKHQERKSRCICVELQQIRLWEQERSVESGSDCDLLVCFIFSKTTPHPSIICPLTSHLRLILGSFPCHRIGVGCVANIWHFTL